MWNFVLIVPCRSISFLGNLEKIGSDFIGESASTNHQQLFRTLE
jgi:hypothetical protein